MNNNNKLFSTVNLIKMALLGVIAVLLMQFGAIKLPAIFPTFLELDFSEVSAIIGSMTIHPLAGMVIIILKNVLKVVLFQTSTAYAGELANLVVSMGYILPLTLMISRNNCLKRVSIGIGLGIVTMTLAGALINYFVVLPMYAKLFMPMESIVGMGHVVCSKIVDKWTLVLYAIIPFNLVKGTCVALASVILVNGLKPVIVQMGYHCRKGR